MTGWIIRSSTPPPELISSMARSVAFSCDCSTAEVTPVWENSTPTRHGASVFSLELMSLTLNHLVERSERPYVRLQETQIALPENRKSSDRALAEIVDARHIGFRHRGPGGVERAP